MKRVFFFVLLLSSSMSWAANQQVLIDVEAMTCPLCVTVINQVLRETEGVIKAKASLKTRQAKVIVPQGFDTQLLLKAIAKTGYTGSIHSVEAQP